MLANHWLAFCSLLYLAGAVTSVVLFFLQADLLLIFFVQAVGSVFLVIGAMTVPSPYSQIGAHRELLQIIAYEPLLILVIVGIFLSTGSFKIEAVYAMEQPLLFKLPLLFLVLGIALTIKLRKSPFDISASHHAHQEIVRGVYTEYSGPYLAIVEIAHWFEIVLILGLLSLFWSTSVVGWCCSWASPISWKFWSTIPLRG
jgi:ech hydrogenase subunit B